ncbi:hypothetical protein FRC14_001877 [Serendipita sp. 396]|nr:hypothetical protein FRC14_001877 [Serendipita sp. 396]KAG8773480.1 hypothetical protein FRC15_001986 [Serendipita sp. 397]KAG8786489.1 hypothetical protein FRC16_001732 [Serendipita sp. 398]KAG8828937.1 hypothetical protein FRC18_009710 [Serendipita sp. 400]KAG8846952.1 hypothetical protein FRB91_000310 [Serendipita sp. 411]KAG8863884.1 hypothetical protein FRC20_010510 [Serendipita sp. 405]
MLAYVFLLNSATLDPATPAHEKLKGIAEGTMDGLMILAPCGTAQTELWKLIATIVGQYVQAINTSVRVAEDGHIFSGEAIQLCKLLLDPEKANCEEPQDSIDKMRATAKKALENCKTTVKMFKQVSRKLIEMWKKVPKVALAVEAGDKNISIRYYHTTSLKPTEIVTAMEKGSLEALSVEKLSEDINTSVKWWSNMETNLEVVYEKVSELVSNKRKQYLARHIKGRWAEIRDDYMKYKSKIAPLRVFYSLDDIKGKLKNIIEDTKECPLIFLLWYTPQTELQKGIKAIVDHCTLYVRAIEKSIELAEDGCTISEDALQICDFLLEPSSDQEMLQTFIDYIQKRTRYMPKTCQDLLGMFSTVCSGLNEAITKIPKEALKEEKGNRIRVVQLYSAVAGSLRFKSNDIEIEMKEQNLAPWEIAKVVAAWWTRMEAKSRIVVEKTSELVPEQINLGLVELIQEKWTEIRDEYVNFKADVIKIRDLYPPGIELSTEDLDLAHADARTDVDVHADTDVHTDINDKGEYGEVREDDDDDAGDDDSDGESSDWSYVTKPE